MVSKEVFIKDFFKFYESFIKVVLLTDEEWFSTEDPFSSILLLSFAKMLFVDDLTIFFGNLLKFILWFYYIGSFISWMLTPLYLSLLMLLRSSVLTAEFFIVTANYESDTLFYPPVLDASWIY